jgi:hypothetical protein
MHIANDLDNASSEQIVACYLLPKAEALEAWRYLDTLQKELRSAAVEAMTDKTQTFDVG